MITDFAANKIDFGLHLVTNENGYTVMCGESRDYPYGGIITELNEMNPMKIKDALLGVKAYFSYEMGTEEASKGFALFYDELRKYYGLASTAMIQAEFLSIIDDYKTAEQPKDIKEYVDMVSGLVGDKIKEFILEDTGYDDFGFDNFGQFLLTAYANFAHSITTLKYAVASMLDDNRYNISDFDSQKGYDLIGALCTDMLAVQHIEFRIIKIEKAFRKLYTVNTVISLMLFEVINCMENDIQFTKCENCGKIFVPEGRKDTKYCSNPSPQNPEKTCREIGAQVARANKEKTDVVTKEYRRRYLSHKMKVRRHPGDIRYSRVLDELTTGMKEWREKLKDGSATVEQFQEWIRKY